MSKILSFIPTCNKLDVASLKYVKLHKDTVIEIYFSSLGKKLLKIKVPKSKFNNLTKGERDALYNFKNDKTIVIKMLIRVQQLMYGTDRTILRKQKINLETLIYMKRSQRTLNYL